MAEHTTPISFDEIDQLAVDTIRGLSMDMVQAANSGHPGTPMGVAPAAYVLWNHVLRYDPTDPIWPGRDRFVLSEGHASVLLWSLLHLAGVHAVDERYEVERSHAVTERDIETFRQLGLPLPGAPRVPLDHRGRDDHRTARPGRRDVGRDGARRALAGRPLRPRRSRAVRLRRLRARG